MSYKLDLNEIIINDTNDLIFVGDNGDKLDLLNNDDWVDTKQIHYKHIKFNNSDLELLIDDNILSI